MSITLETLPLITDPSLTNSCLVLKGDEDSLSGTTIRSGTLIYKDGSRRLICGEDLRRATLLAHIFPQDWKALEMGPSMFTDTPTATTWRIPAISMCRLKSGIILLY